MRSFAATLTSILLLAPALQARPRDELLRLVPADVGFCLVIEDLRGHGKAFVDSPFIQQFASSPLAAKVTGAQEWQKLSLADQFVQQFLHVSAEQLRDEILGDALVLAYRPGPPDKPAEEDGMFLLWARDAKLLSGLIDRLNSLQKDSGDVTDLQEHTYAGQRYFSRVESSGTKHYFVHGSLLAFCSREETLRQLIDRASKGDTLPALAGKFSALGVDRPLAALWVNPRAFDAHLEKQAAAADGGKGKALTTLLGYWRALDGLAFTFDLKEDLEVAVAVKARTEALPAAARRFFDAASRPSELWQRFPDNTLLAGAGRFDVAALVDVFSHFLPEEARKSAREALEGRAGAVFGKNIVQEMLPDVGPDWGFCALAPSAPDSGWAPRLLAAVRLQPGNAARPTDLTIVNGLSTLAALLVFHHNGGKPGALSLKSALQDRVEVHYLANEQEFPAGVEPAFALKGGFLVTGSSLEMMRAFPEATPAKKERPSSEEFPLARLSLKELSRYLRERRAVFAGFAAKQHQISEEEAGTKLDGLLAILHFLDRVELSQRPDPGRVIFTLRVHTSKPLK
jgi:hypothetical protein